MADKNIKNKAITLQSPFHYGKFSCGYTLIEAVVSLALLLIALIPALLLATNSADVAAAIQHNIIASDLAQEGIEVVRAARDTNWIASSSFDNGLPAGNYEVQWDSTPPFSAYQDRPLLVDDRGVYGYSAASASASIYKRKVTIAKPSSVELQIISEVTWQERSRNRSVKAEAHLFDWR